MWMKSQKGTEKERWSMKECAGNARLGVKPCMERLMMVVMMMMMTMERRIARVKGLSEV
jgi:hypothetical protein